MLYYILYLHLSLNIMKQLIPIQSKQIEVTRGNKLNHRWFFTSIFLILQQELAMRANVAGHRLT